MSSSYLFLYTIIWFSIWCMIEKLAEFRLCASTAAYAFRLWICTFHFYTNMFAHLCVRRFQVSVWHRIPLLSASYSWQWPKLAWIFSTLEWFALCRYMQKCHDIYINMLIHAHVCNKECFPLNELFFLFLFVGSPVKKNVLATLLYCFGGTKSCRVWFADQPKIPEFPFRRNQVFVA